MEIWIAVVIAAIIVGTAYSVWRQLSYSIVASILCVLTLLLTFLMGQTDWNEALYQVGFNPKDLLDAERSYTLLTSMFAHAGFGHILFNVLMLVFLGTVLEQRVGTRPVVVLFFVSGLVGTLLVAAFHWNDPTYLVVGASGAIFGLLGAYARLYPTDRAALFPLPPMPIWTIVILLVLLQFFLALTSAQIAYEAHLGGLAAGVLLAPVIVRLPMHKRVKRTISLSSLRRLATTPELKQDLRRIEDETVPDVRSAWIEHFLSKARCPHCGSRLKVSKEAVTCEKGHLI